MPLSGSIRGSRSWGIGVGEKLAELRGLIQDAEPDVEEGWQSEGKAVWSYNGILLIADGYEDRLSSYFIAELCSKTQKACSMRVWMRTSGGRLNCLKVMMWTRRRSRRWCDKRCLTTRNVALELAKGGKYDGKPVLLSGGNPQIPKSDGDGPIRTYIEAIPGWKRETTRRIDEIIVENVPDVLKAVRWNSPFYGIEGRGWFVSYHMFSRYIKVTFLNGAVLEPEPPGSGKDPRQSLDRHLRGRARRGAAWPSGFGSRLRCRGGTDSDGIRSVKLAAGCGKFVDSRREIAGTCRVSKHCGVCCC